MSCPAERAIDFLESFADRLSFLEKFGHDVLFMFWHVSATSQNANLRRRARDVGQYLAKRWRQRQRIPADPEKLICVLMAEQAAHDLGQCDLKFRQTIRLALCKRHIVQNLVFDPEREAPPADIPDYCVRCNRENVRGRRYCAYCGKKLEILSPYGLWLNALVVTHHLRRSGPIETGMYSNAVRWLHTMRPYPKGDVMEDDETWEAAYAVTHLIYTLTDYCQKQLSAGSLKPEYEFLRSSLSQALVGEDCDLAGECIDALAAFGLSRNGNVLRPGIRFLISHQNEDGSWGSVGEEDDVRLHTTWAAIDGIREHSWRRRKLSKSDISRLFRRKK